MYEIYSTITRQMILNIIKEMTNRINLASAKPVDLLVSITDHYCAIPFLFPFCFIFRIYSLPLSFLHLFFFLVYTFVVYCQPNIRHQEHNDICSCQRETQQALISSFRSPMISYSIKREASQKFYGIRISSIWRPRFCIRHNEVTVRATTANNLTCCLIFRTTSATGQLFECYEDKLPETKARPSWTSF